MSTPKPTHADDLERMVRILSDAPLEGLSLYLIQLHTEQTGERWSMMTINGLLCDLGSRVAHQKIRTRTGKETRYHLRRN